MRTFWAQADLSHWTKAQLIALLTHLKAHFIQTQHSQVRCEDILARPTIFFSSAAYVQFPGLCRNISVGTAFWLAHSLIGRLCRGERGDSLQLSPLSDATISVISHAKICLMYECTPLYALGMHILIHFFKQWSTALTNDGSFMIYEICWIFFPFANCLNHWRDLCLM